MLNKRGPKIEPCRTTNIRLIFILFFYSKGNLESFSSRKKAFLLSTAFFYLSIIKRRQGCELKKPFGKPHWNFENVLSK